MNKNKNSEQEINDFLNNVTIPIKQTEEELPVINEALQQQVGVLDTRDALRRAQDVGLDLIEIAPKAKPPVCRIMDYSKYRYQMAKKEKENKKENKKGKESNKDKKNKEDEKKNNKKKDSEEKGKKQKKKKTLEEKEEEIRKKRKMIKIPAMLKQIMSDDSQLQKKYLDTSTKNKSSNNKKKDW